MIGMEISSATYSLLKGFKSQVLVRKLRKKIRDFRNWSSQQHNKANEKHSLSELKEKFAEFVRICEYEGYYYIFL